MTKTYKVMQNFEELIPVKSNISPYVNSGNLQHLKNKSNLADLLTNTGISDSTNRHRIYHFASTNTGEGTSTILISLARYLVDINSQKDILLVDANFKRPVFHSAFNVPLTPGLCEVMKNEVSISEALHKFDSSSVHIMPCGNTTGSSFSLDSDTLKQYIVEFKKKFQFILLDSPPLLASPISAILASIADVSFLVVQGKRTQWEVAHEAKKILEKQNVRIGGVILNRIRYNIPNWLYNRL